MRTTFANSFICIAAMLVSILSVSCRKEQQEEKRHPVTASPTVPASPVLSGVLGTGHFVQDSILLTSGVQWHLNGLVYVDSGDVLIIQPGTLILGDVSPVPNLPGGGLIVTRGARIIANGTQSAPIVFTSERYNTSPASGDWSGVTIIGNAPTNLPFTTRIEGVTNVTPADVTFGGYNATDNSGILRYVRIEYGGYVLSADNELNGLTFAGVGNGTTVDYVEVYKAFDDAFEFFGGTVNASHLIAIDPVDDLFDTDNGYTGNISYALGLTDTSYADFSQSNGIESDNNVTGANLVPHTHAKYNYITIVGLPNVIKASQTYSTLPGIPGKYGRAAHLRRDTEFEIRNSIFLGFNNGFSFNSTTGNTYSKFLGGVSIATGNFVQAFVNPFATEVTNVFTGIPAPAGNTGYTTVNPNTDIKLANPFVRLSFNSFIPGALAPVNVKSAGAFPLGATAWANGWAVLH